MDNKFIIGKIDHEFSSSKRVLVALDQHAMHERINLEALEDMFFLHVKTNEEKCQSVCKKNLPIFDMMIKRNQGFWVIMKMDEVYKDLYHQDLMMLRNYAADLNNYDIKIEIDSKGKVYFN